MFIYIHSTLVAFIISLGYNIGVCNVIFRRGHYLFHIIFCVVCYFIHYFLHARAHKTDYVINMAYILRIIN